MTQDAGYTPDFDAALQAFVAGAQKLIDQHTTSHFTNLKPDVLSIDPKGVKFIRIVRKHVDRDGVVDNGGSVHCFIDKSNGDVLKAAGWKAPAKHARGNIFDDKHGLGTMGPYGPAYLR